MKTVSKHIFLPLILVLLAAVLTVSISAQELDVGIPVEEYPELFLERTMPTHGEGKIAVFLIQFPDYKNDKPDATAEYYNQLYFSAEPLDANTAGNPWYGSVATFYRDQSMGKLNLSGRVFDWYTAKHERSYYDSMTKKVELVMEAVAYYEAKGVDFAQFDGDGNGELDAVLYHFAGPADDEGDEPWYDGIEYSTRVGETANGKKINSFVQLDNKIEKDDQNSERLRRIICHELMHTLGMYDLYGSHVYLPTEDLMVSDTATVNPYYKILLGWTDKVTLVTANAPDIGLNLWAEGGETLLVTDQYNGIFDEFYLIAYVQSDSVTAEKGIRILHVDARLNAAGTAFLYSNQRYDITAEQQNASNFSAYPFLEEILRIPYADGASSQNAKGIAFGPNSIPGTDTHDGRYTGIRVDDFKLFDTYVTMDITFGYRDTAAPEFSDEQTEIGFVTEYQLIFSEFVYPAKNWGKIQLTTLTGEVIPARITRSHTLAYAIEIVMEGNIPQNGYHIVLPEGCVRDSSGNENKAVTIPVVPDRHIFEQSRTFIPWYYQDRERRWEDSIHSFSYEGENIHITATGEGDQWAAFLEFLKTDAYGNVVAHKFIQNPYDGTYSLRNAYLANDGSCIVTLFDTINYKSVLVCIDKNGNLRWHKVPEGDTTRPAAAYGDGILYCGPSLSFVDARTGEFTVREARDVVLSDVCFNGRDMVGVYHSLESIVVIDPVSLTVKGRHDLNLDGIDGIAFIAYNQNGTYTLLINRGPEPVMAVILDASFRIVKQVFLDDANDVGHMLTYQFCPNDGLVVAICVQLGNHANNAYHITRMDEHLNVMWKSELKATGVSFFITASNEVGAFANFWSPKREAYLLKFGSEDSYELTGHTMTHHAAQTATCLAEGQIEHWTCSDCGGYFTDADGKNATTAASVILPKAAHVPQAYTDVAPTCTAAGSTGGTYCKTCTWELTPKTVIPATGHAPVEDAAVAPTYEREGLTAGSHCGVCNAVITAQQSIPRLEPETTAAPATTAASETTAASATTEAPVTKVPPAWPPAHTVKDKSSSVTEFEDVIPIVIAVVPAAVLVVVLVMILKKRK
ncbi:MAG: immune inhibitor A [Clostridia bacterium]|nr:immune inhibitor A [Clostridia bacterium]